MNDLAPVADEGGEVGLMPAPVCAGVAPFVELAKTALDLPRLKRLGDLLDWRLSEADRQLVVSYLGSKWDTKLGNTKKMQL